MILLKSPNGLLGLSQCKFLSHHTYLVQGRLFLIGASANTDIALDPNNALFVELQVHLTDKVHHFQPRTSNRGASTVKRGIQGRVLCQLGNESHLVRYRRRRRADLCKFS